MDRELVLRFITLPMVVTVFKQDKENFAASKVLTVYHDLFDNRIEKVENDFKQLKSKMFTEYHLDVRYLGKANDIHQYRVNREIIEFTSLELRNKTEELMKEYLSMKN